MELIEQTNKAEKYFSETRFRSVAFVLIVIDSLKQLDDSDVAQETEQILERRTRSWLDLPTRQHDGSISERSQHHLEV